MSAASEVSGAHGRAVCFPRYTLLAGGRKLRLNLSFQEEHLWIFYSLTGWERRSGSG